MPRDAYRILLLALGPGLAAGAASWLLLGYGLEADNVVLRTLFTYAYLLLWSLPAMPALALALARWLPGQRLIGPLRSVAFLAVLVAPGWHLIVLEVIGWFHTGESFLLRNGPRVAAAYFPAIGCTAAAWALQAAARRRGASPPA